MDRGQMRGAILERIQRPKIPAAWYPVSAFGVVPDSGQIQTGLLQKAIDRVSENGGGRLLVPAGHYRTGALRLKSGVELHLASEDTVITFVNEDVEDHYPVVFSHWESTPCYNFSPLLYACDAHDIALTGKGILDGGADLQHWWDWHHQVEEAWSADKKDLQLEDRKALRRMNAEGVPVEERVFGPGHFLRPPFVQTIRCKRVLLKGVTLKNSPMWQLNPVLCESLTVKDMTLSSHGANNDGCDPESCSGVHIVGCRFDTGDDCISLKSGRDRDGRETGRPCEYVLIEGNEFADGHGGIALGSEMSGGIRFVLAQDNHFSSRQLTYGLRLKTNARRGGRVEDILLADSVIEHVHGAAVHGTMLYEDGRNGEELPVFQNITIEGLTAHGGDYGIFLEAFDEVPVTGLVLKDIRIDGTRQAMRSMNWKDPVVEDVTINGKRFPRPGKVRILGVPVEGGEVHAQAEYQGGKGELRFTWEVIRGEPGCQGEPGDQEEQEDREEAKKQEDLKRAVVWDALGDLNGQDDPDRSKEQGSPDSPVWIRAGEGERFVLPGACQAVRVTARDQKGDQETSRSYLVLSRREAAGESDGRKRLICHGMLQAGDPAPDRSPITRAKLAQMLLPLAGPAQKEDAIGAAIACGFFPKEQGGSCQPDRPVTRQEMATVAMQACGVNYRNASSTMPVCTDAAKVRDNFGTNVARALYFGFMELDERGCFQPERPVTMEEAVAVLNRVADYAGI